MTAVPGYSGCQMEPPSLQTPVCTKSRTGLWFREGEEDPVPRVGISPWWDSLASPQLGSDAATSRDPPPEASGKSQCPEDQAGPRVSFVKPTEADFSQHPWRMMRRIEKA